MSRSSDEWFVAADRAAVEPIAALVAVLAVGAALGLYVGVLDDVRSDATEGPEEASVVVDRIERDVTLGGVARPSRLSDLGETRTPATVELVSDGETWRVGLGAVGETGAIRPDRRSSAVTERRVTVRVAPGRNTPGTLRVVFHG
ncbi:hypothetical protein J2751_002173 [Halorubrum alkaliphilum]|uniref:Uncharacterized protein n=1 Tax=Halorubrum alkaliphilum TaxID=261290 RepID=A0A8T4GJF0_9EURY|nr:hypothetical protein [Halorubrum alkaliphilum]MBP1923135.1 hypothetical protein [Halorubrum alkaliphilum]